jgi:hypothetical protein
MSGHPHWRGQVPAEPGRSGFSSVPASPQACPRRQRRGLVAFAVALTMALGTVLMTIAASSVQAMADPAMFNDPKSDGWVGMAAIGSVLVCALLGMIIVHRYTVTRHR